MVDNELITVYLYMSTSINKHGMHLSLFTRNSKPTSTLTFTRHANKIVQVVDDATTDHIPHQVINAIYMVSEQIKQNPTFGISQDG